MTEKCGGCHKVFPRELMHVGYYSGVPYRACPLCQLKTRNMTHGLPLDTPFSGTIAQGLVEDALAWLKKGEAK